MKVGGRLHYSESAVEKHPIILPRNDFSMKIIRQVHEKNGHVGVNHTLYILRQRFFVLKGYQTVKKVVGDCFVCKRLNKGPCIQQMASLPKERTAVDEPPFAAVGVDYFGPMLVKHGRGTAKRYGCLFTCPATRAVPLEVSSSLDTDAFLMSLHRFIARSQTKYFLTTVEIL